MTQTHKGASEPLGDSAGDSVTRTEDALAEEHARLRRVGGHWTGRERYAAAMALHRAGEVGPRALEVFRVCARRDDTDPFAILSDRGIGLGD